MFNTPEYACWRNMISRCTLKSADKKKRYFHRGILVCDRWRNSFENFYSDIGARPSGKHSIERKNNDGNYEKSNCEWAIKKTQTRNRRTSKIIFHDGQSLSLAEWSERLGFNYKTIFRRLAAGMAFAEAISTPVRHSSRWHGDR